MVGFSITKTKTAIPRLPYEKIKNDILGSEYVVSLVFIGEKRARELNTEYRKKTYTPNVLAFPLDDSNGEIFMCTKKLPREAPLYNMNVKNYTGYLFIHALLHLKGHDHGATMERIETKYLKKFGLT
jgi:probable rRNA maturation factor